VRACVHADLHMGLILVCVCVCACVCVCVRVRVQVQVSKANDAFYDAYESSNIKAMSRCACMHTHINTHKNSRFLSLPPE